MTSPAVPNEAIQNAFRRKQSMRTDPCLHLSVRTTPLLEESVRATLSPLSPSAQSPRASTDVSRASSDFLRKSMDLTKFGRRSVDLSRLNMDGGRRSMSASRRSSSRNRLADQGHQRSLKQGSSDSFVHSLEDPGSAAAFPSASDETHASASQILRGSDVFLSPTIRRTSSASRTRDPDPLAAEYRTHTPSRNTVNIGSMQPTPQIIADKGLCARFKYWPGRSFCLCANSDEYCQSGSLPFTTSGGICRYLNKHSKRMSTLLATESMGYVEKVSGMWKGGKKHYDEPLGQEDELFDAGDDEQIAESGERFRDHFALPPTEKLQAAYFGFSSSCATPIRQDLCE